MKILELRFKNLNSLKGEWCIDFTDPEYVSHGIFAISGATGAGKSTILDAICLALYGATPRLGKITKSSNEIMSRHTGECYAEILFESQSGRYRCQWAQKKARSLPNGKLQDQQHQISHADTGQYIETKKSAVIGVVEEKTGMDFDRFTRSILLAQGGFDTFLKADIEQKSKILEQITGTEIYSEISRKTHERHRTEKESFEKLKAETSGIVILGSDQENQIQQNLEAHQAQEITLIACTTNTEKGIQWLANIEAFKKELYILSAEEGHLQERLEAFKLKRNTLEQALKAASMDGIYSALDTLRTQQANDQNALTIPEAELPELEADSRVQADSLENAELIHNKAKKEMKEASPLLQKIRSLDQAMAAQAKAIEENSARCTNEAVKIEFDQQKKIKEQQKRAETEKMLAQTEQYIKEHSADEWLVSGLTGIEEQVNHLISQQKEIDQKELSLKKANLRIETSSKNLKVATQQSIDCKQELKKTEGLLSEKKEILSTLLSNQLLREIRAEKEHLQREMIYINKIKELEDHRSKLEDGKHCPLCGAVEHPFAKGNVPVPDEIEKNIDALTQLIAKAEELEAAIKKLEVAETAAREKLNTIEKLEAGAAHEKIVATTNFDQLQDELKKLQSGFAQAQLAISKKLQPLGIIDIPEKDLTSLLLPLKSRLNAWQHQFQLKNNIEKQIALIDSEIKRLDAVIETQSQTLAENEESLKKLKTDHADGMENRHTLYGDQRPDDEESRLNKVMSHAEKEEAKARAQSTELQQKLMATQSRIEVLKKSIEQREPDLQKAEAAFLLTLEFSGFSEEKQFLEARLPREERASLSFQAKELDNAQTELKAKKKDREIRLTEEADKKVTDQSFEALGLKLNEHQKSLQEVRDTIASFKYKLSENAVAKERYKEKQLAIESQEKERDRWRKLDGLIGSADGKKYRNFAQGLTFEVMVAHANRQLEKMTDRYLLTRDEVEPLELNVIDNYQAGEKRSIKNLSGGECFIVSLSLALGLSKMSSKKVRVDSLFLDEGFGTLDEEALDTALDALSSLHQENKLIGVISHIPALKNRISTQILVQKQQGGRSIISGPGCKGPLC